jgi:hypothetical protein
MKKREHTTSYQKMKTKYSYIPLERWQGTDTLMSTLSHSLTHTHTHTHTHTASTLQTAPSRP